MTNILITGIDGFLGRSLEGYVRKYRLPYNVYGMDSALKRSTKKKFKINVKNKETVKRIIKELRPRYIYHFAGDGRSSDFNDLMKANVVYSRVLLEAVLELKINGMRVIVPGSAAEYGQPKPESLPIQETAEPNPVTKYGFSKMYQVLLALGYQQKGIDILIGRIFNICGWGVPQTFALGKFARDIALIKQHKKKIVIETKELNCKRDFLDIEDVCAALLVLAERGKGGEVYNICSGRSYRIGKLLDQLLYIAKCEGIRITTVASASPRIEDIYGSNKKIKIDTGWHPKISMHESLKNILNYYGALQSKP